MRVRQPRRIAAQFGPLLRIGVKGQDRFGQPARLAGAHRQSRHAVDDGVAHGLRHGRDARHAEERRLEYRASRRIEMAREAHHVELAVDLFEIRRKRPELDRIRQRQGLDLRLQLLFDLLRQPEPPQHEVPQGRAAPHALADENKADVRPLRPAQRGRLDELQAALGAGQPAHHADGEPVMHRSGRLFAPRDAQAVVDHHRIQRRIEARLDRFVDGDQAPRTASQHRGNQPAAPAPQRLLHRADMHDHRAVEQAPRQPDRRQQRNVVDMHQIDPAPIPLRGQQAAKRRGQVGQLAQQDQPAPAPVMAVAGVVELGHAAAAEHRHARGLEDFLELPAPRQHAGLHGARRKALDHLQQATRGAAERRGMVHV